MINEILFDESSSVPRGLSPPPNLFQKYSKMRLPTDQELVEQEECEMLQSWDVSVEKEFPPDVFPFDFPEWRQKIELFEKRKSKAVQRERAKMAKVRRKQAKAGILLKQSNDRQYFGILFFRI